MTLADVKRQILNLGFTSVEEYDDPPSIMVDAINRAMHEITMYVPLIGKYEISQNPFPSLLPSPLKNMDAVHYSGVPITYAANGAKSFYFECDGTGTLTITDTDGTHTIPLASDKALMEYRGFCKGDVTLTFSGDFSYNIKNIAIYGETISGKLTDIPPYRQYIRYDFKELTKENGDTAAVPPTEDRYIFLEFSDKITEGNFTDANQYFAVRDFQIEQGHVLVLNGFEKVQFTIFYKKAFKPITVTTPDDYKIELDFAHEHLLPLLACYYVLADDETRLSEKWHNKYADLMESLQNEAKPNTAEEKFSNTLGW